MHYNAYTDAAFKLHTARGELVGKAATGFILKGEKVIATGYKNNLIARCTNEAELQGVKHVLFHLLQEKRVETILHCDNNYVVNSINYDDYRERLLENNPYLSTLFYEVDQLMLLLPHVRLKWIPREFNEEAHYVATGEDFTTYVDELLPQKELFHFIEPTNDRGPFKNGGIISQTAAQAFLDITKGDWDNDTQLAYAIEKAMRLGKVKDFGNGCQSIHYGKILFFVVKGDVVNAKEITNFFLPKFEKSMYESVLPPRKDINKTYTNRNLEEKVS